MLGNAYDLSRLLEWASSLWLMDFEVTNNQLALHLFFRESLLALARCFINVEIAHRKEHSLTGSKGPQKVGLNNNMC